MKVLITGGFGFLGRQLCKRILALGELVSGVEEEKSVVSEVVLFDVAAAPKDLPEDSRVRAVSGNITDAATCATLVDEDNMIVFHLASIMSGQGEKDFDLCFNVNLMGTKSLLDACRARRGSRFIFPSSGACYGERLPGPETDTVKLLPYTTYGMTKACIELLINDYSRRGFLDGRAARLPTVIPRPEINSGLPAAFSAVIREPLKGQDVTLAIHPDMPHAVCGFRCLVRNVLHLSQLPQAVFSGSVDRTMNMPALRVTLRDMHAAMLSVVQNPDQLGKVKYETDEVQTATLSTFHNDMDATRARSLGFFGDSSAAGIVTDFAAEYLSSALLKPVLELREEPRHNLVLSNSMVKVYRTESFPGDRTLMHAHRVDSLYFFFNGLNVLNEMLGEEPVEDTLSLGEVRYGDHCRCPLVHRITFKGHMFCLDVELVGFAADATAESAEKQNAERLAKKARVESPPKGLGLTKERPGARVYELTVAIGTSWKAVLPYSKMLWVVKLGAQTRGSLGDRPLLPADIFFKEGPVEVELHVSGKQSLALWIVELL